MSFLASIPSPGSSSIGLGPLRLTAYGLMIALGVMAAVWLARRRAPNRGQDPEHWATIATWAVPAGLIGARLYHVITDFDRFRDDLGSVVEVWNGGLGIPGGIILGTLVGLWKAKRLGMSILDGLDVAAPALPLAQAIGRWGNWWNQELFGRPTDLPWAVRIDPEHRPDQYISEPAFHPTFLYESLWNLALCAVLLRLDAKGRFRPGQVFAGYVAGYGLGRLWVEALRIDAANTIGPFRVNTWMSLAFIAVGVAGFVYFGRRRSPVADLLSGGPLEPVDIGDSVEVVVPLDGSAGLAKRRLDLADEPFGSANDDADDEIDLAGEGAEDGGAELRPRRLRPGAEVGVGEDDDGELGDGVDPEERPAAAEVPKRKR